MPKPQRLPRGVDRLPGGGYRARLTEYLGQLASQVSESNNYVDQTSSKTN